MKAMKAMLLIVFAAALFALGCEGSQNPFQPTDPPAYWPLCTAEQLERTPEEYWGGLQCRH